ncbi:MAG: hypothetical protein IJ173_01965 [Kiritimatiellae bacterium]|nr:hypothetical protein [Kiritimatiellia bacterium]
MKPFIESQSDEIAANFLALKARDRYAIDMAASVNIGDKPRDLEAGERAGVGTNILFTGGGPAAGEGGQS